LRNWRRVSCASFAARALICAHVCAFSRLLQAEKARLENALAHLDASNEELRAALREAPDQARACAERCGGATLRALTRAAAAVQDYEDALRENVEVMGTYLEKARVRCGCGCSGSARCAVALGLRNESVC
jgi:hypothetical protein